MFRWCFLPSTRRSRIGESRTPIDHIRDSGSQLSPITAVSHPSSFPAPMHLGGTQEAKPPEPRPPCNSGAPLGRRSPPSVGSHAIPGAPLGRRSPRASAPIRNSGAPLGRRSPPSVGSHTIPGPRSEGEAPRASAPMQFRELSGDRSPRGSAPNVFPGPLGGSEPPSSAPNVFPGPLGGRAPEAQLLTYSRGRSPPRVGGLEWRATCVQFERQLRDPNDMGGCCSAHASPLWSP